MVIATQACANLSPSRGPKTIGPGQLRERLLTPNVALAPSCWQLCFLLSGQIPGVAHSSLVGLNVYLSVIGPPQGYYICLDRNCKVLINSNEKTAQPLGRTTWLLKTNYIDDTHIPF